jgi:hypothetical protein
MSAPTCSIMGVRVLVVRGNGMKLAVAAWSCTQTMMTASAQAMKTASAHKKPKEWKANGAPCRAYNSFMRKLGTCEGYYYRDDGNISKKEIYCRTLITSSLYVLLARNP